MKERLARLKAIRRLIKSNQIESQEGLLNYLEKEGFSVTQATLSRDLKLLRVGKISSGPVYVYALPAEDAEGGEKTCVGDFLRGYISIDWSGNLAVIKTHPGHADTVALAIDLFNMDEVMGAIAGRDNTVFIALREGVSGEDFLARLKEIIPELDE